MDRSHKVETIDLSSKYALNKMQVHEEHLIGRPVAQSVLAANPLASVCLERINEILHEGDGAH